MSRTYRLRRLPQPEGGDRTRRFVDSSVSAHREAGEEEFFSNLAHRELKLPCKLKGGKAARCAGWRASHRQCLPREVNLVLYAGWSHLIGWTYGYVKVLPKWNHPILGYGLACVPSGAKKYGRKEVYGRVRQETRRRLLIRDGALAEDWDELLFPDIAAELSSNAYCLT